MLFSVLIIIIIRIRITLQLNQELLSSTCLASEIICRLMSIFYFFSFFSFLMESLGWVWICKWCVEFVEEPWLYVWIHIFCGCMHFQTRWLICLIQCRSITLQFLVPTNKVISVLPGCRVLGGKHAKGKGKVGWWVRAEGRINKNWCKKCGRPTGLDRATPLQRTSVKQLKERGGDRGENAGIERNNSQGGGEESKGGKASEHCVSLAPWREQSISNWSSSSAQQGILNQSQIDLCARGRENLQWSLSEI